MNCFFCQNHIQPANTIFTATWICSYWLWMPYRIHFYNSSNQYSFVDFFIIRTKTTNFLLTYDLLSSQKYLSVSRIKFGFVCTQKKAKDWLFYAEASNAFSAIGLFLNWEYLQTRSKSIEWLMVLITVWTLISFIRWLFFKSMKNAF